MKSSDICDALRKRYKQPEWALFFEVANGTGANCRRHADALAMNMYPSRGLTIVGFEIKVSHGDLKKELDNPAKAEEIAQYCDEWYLATPKNLIKTDDMIPEPWGIIECCDGTLKIKKRAEPLTAKDVTKEFMAAVLRSANKLDNETIGNIRNEVYAESRKYYDDLLKSKVASETKRLQGALQKYKAIEELIGERVTSYTDVDDFAKRWKMATDIDALYGRYGGLESLASMMKVCVQRIEDVAKEVKA